MNSLEKAGRWILTYMDIAEDYTTKDEHLGKNLYYLSCIHLAFCVSACIRSY